VGPFALLCGSEAPLVEGVAKAFKNKSQGGGSLAVVGPFALLCGSEAPLVEGVAKAFKNNSQGGGSLAGGGSVCFAVWVGSPWGGSSF
jgi:phosphoribosylamine-glycine ligase